MKITDDGKLTTLSKAIKNGDGIALSEETKDGKTTQTLSAKVDGTTIIINSDGQIAQKQPTNVYYYPFKMKGYKT